VAVRVETTSRRCPSRKDTSATTCPSGKDTSAPTLFVLLMLVLATQAFRHVYVKWFEPKGSVLDEFREPVEKDVAASKTLDELKAMYAKARSAKDVCESGKPLREVDLARRTGQVVCTEADELRAAIERVEEQDRSLFKLWFYRLCRPSARVWDDRAGRRRRRCSPQCRPAQPARRAARGPP
jgi:hypothetical protein